jgi:hypothetical protein
MSLRRLIADRLAATGRNPFEAARIGGLERSFVNDILIGKKASVRSNSLRKLARALDASESELTQAMMTDDAKSQISSSSEDKTAAVPIESFLAMVEALAMELGLRSEDARTFAKVAFEVAQKPPDPRVATPALEQARLRALDVLDRYFPLKGRK